MSLSTRRGGRLVRVPDTRPVVRARVLDPLPRRDRRLLQQHRKMRRSLETTQVLVHKVDRLLAVSGELGVLPGLAEDLRAAVAGDRAALSRITVTTANVAKNPDMSPAQRTSAITVIDAVWTVLSHVKKVETARDRTICEIETRLAAQVDVDRWCAEDDDILEQLDPDVTAFALCLDVDLCAAPLRDVSLSVAPINGPNASVAARIPLDRVSAAAA